MLKIFVCLMLVSMITIGAEDVFVDDLPEILSPTKDPRKISTKNNSVFLGKVMDTDEILLDEEVEVKGEPGKITERTIYFPKKGENNTKRINFISIIDADLWEEGGTPTVLSGGVNHTHATIHLKSQKGLNLDFLIVIRGRQLEW